MRPWHAAALLACAGLACRPSSSEHETHAGPAAAAGSIAPDPHAGHRPPASASAVPSGYAPFTLDPARADSLKLETAVVEESDLTKALRTVGVVALDETRSAHVHAKIRGWIDGIHVNFVGRKVAAGEALCSIYSQEVYAAEIEFVSILEHTRSGPRPTGELAEAETRAQGQLVEAARRRLSLWDVPKTEVARLEASREPRRTFPLLAPRAGVVVSKEAVDGAYVDPSVELYTLSDLSHVWILVDVYESDVPFVHVGDHARLTVEGQDAPLDATVAFLAPTIDEATRTVKARFEVANKNGGLRPGAFVSAEMQLHLGRGLVIPETAVIRTGPRSIVFVVHEEAHHLMPREVKLGALVGDRYRVEEGLTAGERVATGAQFLLDSESRLRASSMPAGHVH
jgi:Cu(I)/Ag(I) efflux system membrane fusion protein